MVVSEYHTLSTSSTETPKVMHSKFMHSAISGPVLIHIECLVNAKAIGPLVVKLSVLVLAKQRSPYRG
jgi:hypothetical protein